MGWGWYLQNDVQLFIFSLIIIFIYTLNRIAAKIFIWISIIASLIFTYKWTFDNGTFVTSHLVDFGRYGDYMANVYMKPWARAPPYIFGLFLGMLYFEYL